MKLEETAAKLEQNGFKTKIFKSSAEVRAAVMNLIPPHAKVGIGGSMTIFSMGLHESLAEEGRTVHKAFLGGIVDRHAVDRRQIFGAALVAQSRRAGSQYPAHRRVSITLR